MYLNKQNYTQACHIKHTHIYTHADSIPKCKDGYNKDSTLHVAFQSSNRDHRREKLANER